MVMQLSYSIVVMLLSNFFSCLCYVALPPSSLSALGHLSVGNTERCRYGRLNELSDPKSTFCHADRRTVGLRPRTGCSEPKVEAFLSGFPSSRLNI